MLLHRLDTVRGVQGRAVSEAAGIWMKGGASGYGQGAFVRAVGAESG